MTDDERRILIWACFAICLWGGFVLGFYFALEPVGQPYTTEEIQAHLLCQAVNNTLTNCVSNGDTTFYKICIRSYWWGSICHTYRTVYS